MAKHVNLKSLTNIRSLLLIIIALRTWVYVYVFVGVCGGGGVRVCVVVRVNVWFNSLKLENAHSCMHVYLLRSKRETMYMYLHSSLLCLKRCPTWFVEATKGNPINEEPRGNRTHTTTNIGRARTKLMRFGLVVFQDFISSSTYTRLKGTLFITFESEPCI